MRAQTKTSAVIKSLGFALLFFACQYAAAYLSQILILFVQLLSGLSADAALSNLNGIYTSLVNEVMTLAGLLFLGTLFVLQRKNFGKQNAFASCDREAAFSGILLGFACYLAANYLLQWATVIPGFDAAKDSYVEQQEVLTQAARNPLIEILYTCILGPVAEEILFRGSILSTLKKSFSPGVAIFLNALGFAIFHGNLYQGVFTLPLGIVLAYLTLRFRSLWPAIGLHIAFNSSGYLMRLGSLFGFAEESTEWLLFYYAMAFFCYFCVPAGIILLRSALVRTHSERMKNAPIPSQNEAPASAQENAVKGTEMAAPEYIIVGLGNPGEKYESTRHNCGFMALDYIALRLNVSLQDLRFRALTAEAVIEGKKVLLLKPQTFMNSSGESVREAAAFYKIPPEKILVIFDDISFEPGIFRIRKNGSAGGHNGIKSIISCLSSDGFCRVKIGVGTPPPNWELMNWVLGRFPEEDLKHVISSMEDVYATAKAFVADELDRAAANFNGKKH